MRILKVLLLKSLGFQNERGEPGLYLAGDQRGRFLIIEIIEIYPNETAARSACLNLFLKRVDQQNRSDQLGPDSKAA